MSSNFYYCNEIIHNDFEEFIVKKPFNAFYVCGLCKKIVPKQSWEIFNENNHVCFSYVGSFLTEEINKEGDIPELEDHDPMDIRIKVEQN
jgi:hypothetical protein